MQTAHPQLTASPQHSCGQEKAEDDTPSCMQRGGRRYPPCQGALADRLHKVHTHTARTDVAQPLPVCPCPTAGLAGAAGHPGQLGVPMPFWPPSAPCAFFRSPVASSSESTSPSKSSSSPPPPPALHCYHHLDLSCHLSLQTVSSQTRHMLVLRARSKTGFPTPILWNLGLYPGCTDAACAQTEGLGC